MQTQIRNADPLVPVTLNDNRVTRSFREALFEAADRDGLTPKATSRSIGSTA